LTLFSLLPTFQLFSTLRPSQCPTRVSTRPTPLRRRGPTSSSRRSHRPPRRTSSRPARRARCAPGSPANDATCSLRARTQSTRRAGTAPSSSPRAIFALRPDASHGSCASSRRVVSLRPPACGRCSLRTPSRWPAARTSPTTRRFTPCATASASRSTLPRHGPSAVLGSISRMAADGMLSIHDGPPFLPFRTNPQGAVFKPEAERSGDCSKPRRVSDCGAPHSRLRETHDRKIRSVNDQVDPRGGLWPPERKPFVRDIRSSTHLRSCRSACGRCCARAVASAGHWTQRLQRRAFERCRRRVHVRPRTRHSRKQHEGLLVRHRMIDDVRDRGRLRAIWMPSTCWRRELSRLRAVHIRAARSALQCVRGSARL